MSASSPIEPPPTQAGDTRSWWLRQRPWLIGALVLGTWAFVAPYREAREQYDAFRPQAFDEVDRGEAGELVGARWRLLGATRIATLPAEAGTPLRPDSDMLVVRFEVTPGSDTDIDLLDACRGQLVDADDDRRWDANPLTLTRYRSADGVGTMCGSRMGRDFKRVSARVGQPFVFQHLYQLPKTLPTAGLQVEVRMPARHPVPDPPALRFGL